MDGQVVVHGFRPRKVHYATGEDGYGRIHALCYADREPARVSPRSWTNLANDVTCRDCIALLTTPKGTT